MNIHYTSFQEFELNVSEAKLRHILQELTLPSKEDKILPTSNKYFVGDINHNNFWLEKNFSFTTLGDNPFAFSTSQIIGEYEHDMDSIRLRVWSRLKPIFTYMFIIGLPLWLAIIFGLPIDTEYQAFLIILISILSSSYQILLLMVKYDALRFKDLIEKRIKETSLNNY